MIRATVSPAELIALVAGPSATDVTLAELAAWRAAHPDVRIVGRCTSRSRCTLTPKDRPS